MRLGAAVLVSGLAGALAGCTLITDSFLTNEFSGDPFPVHVETTSGAVIVGLRQADHPDREVVLDLLSPVTLVDPGPTVQPSLTFVDLILLGGDGAGGPPSRPRARFVETQLISLHPCQDECGGAAGCDPAQCNVGPPEAPRPFAGVLGADVLAGDAVRLRLGDDQLFILPDIGGSDRGRSQACEAVFPSPYRGGGTLVVGGTELPFGNRRITLQACLGGDPDPRDHADVPTLRTHGTDALFVMSTGIGTSIINQSTYERYLRDGGAPEPEATGAVYLPSGLITGRRVHVDRLALVAGSTSNPLSPCRQIYAHRLLTAQGRITREQCAPDGTTADNVTRFDCVCKDDSDFCDAPAILELAPPERVELLVVPDGDPTLQALRTELRPDQAEVDGLLGTNVLGVVELDVDYPHDRLVARCTTGDCTARPQLTKEADRARILGCLGNQPTGPILRD